MKLLFVVNRMTHIRHFDRVVRLLSDRGHDVCLGSQDGDLERRGVLSEQARITSVDAPRNRSDAWASHATLLRRARDYVRFLHPRYAAARPLRKRAFEKLVRALSGRDIGPEWSELLLDLDNGEQRKINALLSMIERTVPSDPVIDQFLLERRPDALVLSPMVGIGFSQADFVKSARRLGIPTGMLVFSWDNLSNKGLIHEDPDRMIVWNDVQRREAGKLHGYPTDRVVVTGAPRFDAFFELRPATTREQFCRLSGLDPSTPIICYLCSSKFVAATERAFVERWIGELRQSTDAALASCSIVVRPHPGAMDLWQSGESSVVRWPGQATDKAATSRPFADPKVVVLSSPMENADQVLFDTVHHSAAVVGLNTSAEIEAGIVGRPVYTILDGAAEGQQGSLHFRYLLSAQGGHVHLAETFDEHRAQLSDALAGRYDRAALETFVRTFVRPKGLDTPVAPLVADAIEALTTLKLDATGGLEQPALVP